MGIQHHTAPLSYISVYGRHRLQVMLTHKHGPTQEKAKLSRYLTLPRVSAIIQASALSTRPEPVKMFGMKPTEATSSGRIVKVGIVGSARTMNTPGNGTHADGL